MRMMMITDGEKERRYDFHFLKSHLRDQEPFRRENHLLSPCGKPSVRDDGLCH